MNTDKVYAKKIAEEYAPKNDSKARALKRLDDKVKLPPTILTYSLGIISVLIMGVGMCLAMGVLGGGTTLMLVLGIIIGCIGIVGICVNYPIYIKFLSSRKQKYAADIMRLANEIAAEENEEE